MHKKPKQPSFEALSDEKFLQQALEGVVPLKKPATTDSRKPRRRTPKILRDSDKFVDEDVLQDISATDELLSIDSDSAHRKNGVQLRTLKRLKRGHFPPQDQFDLHQLNTRTGKSALLEFINWSCQQNLRCIRIIHGKGLHSVDGPKLKLMSREVLRSHPQIMAFTSCKHNEGGDGATDVLLKTRLSS